jgi:hypothetical protein
MMNLRSSHWVAILAMGIVVAAPSRAAAQGEGNGSFTGQMVMTAQGNRQMPDLSQQDVSVAVDGQNSQISQWKPLRGPDAPLQLVFLIDESAPPSISLQFPMMKDFIRKLPPSTEVAVAYMLNGRAVLQKPLTTDHAAAAATLRLPNSIPGVTGSPYFSLSDLAKKWPSKAKTRRVVFMLTNGEDPYYRTHDLQDPYVRSAITDCQKAGLLVYSLYFHDIGTGGFGTTATLFGQSYLLMVSNETGGVAYTEAMTTPVSVGPFLKQFQTSLDNQYMATITARRGGLQRVKVTSKTKSTKLRAPARVNFGS